MYKFVLVCLVCVGQIQAQEQVVVNQAPAPPQNLVPVPPQNFAPVVVQAPQQNAVPPEWRANGWREQFTDTRTHDVYPFKDYNYPGYQSQTYYQPSVNATNGWYSYDESQPIYRQQPVQYQYQQPVQQNVQVYTSPQQQYYQQPRTYYPQQTYCQPTYQYCQPQYQYCQPQCQPTYQYCQPQYYQQRQPFWGSLFR